MCGKPALIGTERCSAHANKESSGRKLDEPPKAAKSKETVQDISDDDEQETKKTPKRKLESESFSEQQPKIPKTPPKPTGFSYISSALPELKEEQVVLRMVIDGKERFVHRVSGFVFISNTEKIVIGRLDKEKKVILPLTMEMIEEVQKYKLRHGPITNISSRHDVEEIRNELIEKDESEEEEKDREYQDEDDQFKFLEKGEEEEEEDELEEEFQEEM